MCGKLEAAETSLGKIPKMDSFNYHRAREPNVSEWFRILKYPRTVCCAARTCSSMTEWPERSRITGSIGSSERKVALSPASPELSPRRAR